MLLPSDSKDLYLEELLPHLFLGDLEIKGKFFGISFPNQQPSQNSAKVGIVGPSSGMRIRLFHSTFVCINFFILMSSIMTHHNNDASTVGQRRPFNSVRYNWSFPTTVQMQLSAEEEQV